MAGQIYRNKKKRNTTRMTIFIGLVVFIPSFFLCIKTTSLIFTAKDPYLTQAEILRLQQLDDPVVLPRGFRVVDIGASKGRGSSQFLTQALRKHSFRNRIVANMTIGIDIDATKVDVCNKNGQTCMQGNVLKLQVANDTLPPVGATMWHVLEHMPTCDLAKTMWHKASSLVSGFSLFHGPAFDDSFVLQHEGFHRFYEDWSGHTCHWDSTMMVDAITTSPQVATAYIVVLIKPFTSSSSNIVLPKGAEFDSHHYNASAHPPKKTVTFDIPLYEEMRACAIYEPLKVLNLFSALALDDVLSVMKRFHGTIVTCRIAPTGADNNTTDNNITTAVGSDEECQRRLQAMVTAVISRERK